VENRKLILGSSSPRRQEYLARLGVPFQVRVVPIREDDFNSLPPEEAVVAVARAKAQVLDLLAPDEVILTADTIVVLDGEIIGKPRDAADARRTLERLRGREHVVYTALVLRTAERMTTDVVRTLVYMRDYSDAEIAAYIARGEPFDKAGSYAVQDPLFHPVEQVEGCYMNVLGLPLCRLCWRLRELGLAVPVEPKEICRPLVGECPLAEVEGCDGG